MILYLVMIAVATNADALLNAFFGPVSTGTAYLHMGIVLGCLVASDALIAILVRCIPESAINPFLPVFRAGKFERKLQNFLQVRRWKDYIPESGKYLCNFAKDKIAEPDNNDYILKFLRETCYAEMMHIVSLFLPFFFVPFLPVSLTLWLPLVCVNALLQLMPVMVQRYNRPRLVTLYRFNERKAAQRITEEQQTQTTSCEVPHEA